MNDSLKETIKKIKSEFGDGSIMCLSDKPSLNIDVIPTGIISLDLALGIGGIPRGRIIEIYGGESAGKTTLAQHIISESQKKGQVAAIVDAEHALDPDYAQALGVDTDSLLISQPDTGEQALEITEELVRSGAVSLVVIDSVAALTPKAEIDGEMGDSHMGLQARLMSQALRKLTGITSKSNTSIIFINQMRQKIGVVWGNPNTTTGGNALKYYATIRIELSKIETLKKDGQEYGNKVKAKIVKNKVAPPFKIAEFDIIYGMGANKKGSLIDVAIDKKIIEKAGSWYSYGSNKLGQGKDKVIEFLEKNPKLYTELESKIKQLK